MWHRRCKNLKQQGCSLRPRKSHSRQSQQEEREMRRQILTLWVVLVLAVCAVLMAQANSYPPLPPSQQVDQSGQPEHAGRPDVDVDAGKNANNGVLNVDAKRH